MRHTVTQFQPLVTNCWSWKTLSK